MVDYAHKRDDGTVQTVREHAVGTAEYASRFAKCFDSCKEAYYVGLLHDVGKCSDAFQKRLLEDGPRCDHSTAGAQLALKDKDSIAAFAIAGHHAGIPDGGSSADTSNDSTLMGRKLRKVDCFERYHNEIQIEAGEIPAWVKNRSGNTEFRKSFYTRMIFSCLVDADFLDTEKFMRPGNVQRGLNNNFEILSNRMEKYIEENCWDHPRGEINCLRWKMIQQCESAANQKPGIFTLTVPTGGGKTGASMKFALRHAICNGMNRIIYVIPYTSIIEQNAKVFRDMLGEDVVLEHHSNVEYAESEDGVSPLDIKKRLASENWDASIVATTAVQFYESLFASRPSKCRKLHNITNSVIVLDEAQMIPVKYLLPCVAALSELYQHYHCSIVLCTATQPSLNSIFQMFIPGIDIHEICSLSEKEENAFRRVQYQNDGMLDSSQLVMRLSEAKQILCIVNTRKEAQEIYEILPAEGKYHLSTLMTPYDRKKTIEQIRRRLRNNETCRVISTSLIEAGVDIDFPSVYREVAGLDSIIQAGGRCNREGRRKMENSIVHIFSYGKIPTLIRQNVSAAESAMNLGLNYDDERCIKKYFDDLYTWKGGELDSKQILEEWQKGCDGRMMPFDTVAKQFRLIDQDTETIFVEEEESRELIAELRRGEYSMKLYRMLGQFAINVYSQQITKLREMGILQMIEEGIYILRDPHAYSCETGLNVNITSGYGIIL